MSLQRKHREIMVFSISFLDVIASALGAILILFIIQYNKTQSARTEAVVSEARHTQCTEALQEFARQDVNWIDENDSIYNQLRIWSKDSDGKDSLVALGQFPKA